MITNNVLPAISSSLSYKMLLVDSPEFRAVARALEELRLKVKDSPSIRNIEWITRIPITSTALLVRPTIMQLLPAAVELTALLQDKKLAEQTARALHLFMDFINQSLTVISEGEKEESPEDEEEEDEW